MFATFVRTFEQELYNEQIFFLICTALSWFVSCVGKAKQKGGEEGHRFRLRDNASLRTKRFRGIQGQRIPVSYFGSRPNFARAKYRSLVFLCSPTPRKRLLRRLL